MTQSIYEHSINRADGTPIDLSEYEGKVLLIVNTATQCGLAPQFEGLEKLYQDYKDDEFLVIGFPCNQFMNQEPESNDSMEETCKINHGVTFPLTEKVKVNGKNAHPIFKYLKSEKGGFLIDEIKWNFTKFLIDKEANVVKRYSPTTTPDKIAKDIQDLL